MASGAGGLASGLRSGLQLKSNLRSQEATREANRETQVREKAKLVNDSIQKSLDQIGQILESVDANPDLSRDDPRVTQALSPLVTAALQTATQASQTPSMQGLVLDPQSVVSTIKNRVNLSPTPEQRAAGEAQTAVAGARATAEATGATEREALEGAGILPDQPNLQSKTAVRVVDGEIKEVRRAAFNPETGETVGEDGEPLPEGFITTDVAVQDTTEGLANISPTDRRKVQDRQITTANFVSTANDMLSLLQKNPDINTISASAASFVNNMQQEAKTLARTAGLEFDESVFDPAQYEGTFDELGITNERAKSLFVSLAFQAAMASGQSGRSVSDKDVERFMRQVGQKSSDPRAIAATLTDLAARMVRDFQTEYRVRTGQEFEGDLGLNQLPSLNDAAEPSPEPTGDPIIRFQRNEDGKLVPAE